ncbi:MAG: hypothetical protein ACI8WB_005494, partial [Phenylobacterium sp.]
QQRDKYAKVKHIYDTTLQCINTGQCPKNVNQIQALLQIESVKKQLAKAQKSAGKYPYEIEGQLGISGVLGLPLFIILALILGQKCLNNALKVVPQFDINVLLPRCFWLLVVIAVSFFSIRYLKTSILDDDKIWYTSSSFCVRGATLTLIHHLAICLSFVCYSLVASVIWTASARSATPQIDLFHKDGQCGLYLYLRFWVLSIFAGLYFVAVYSIMWLLTIFDGEGEVTNYGSSTLTASVILLTYLIRIFWKMFVLKNRYITALRDSKVLKAHEDVSGKIPEDPTRFFIGRYGEKALVFVFIVIIWIYKELGKSPLLQWIVQPFI